MMCQELPRQPAQSQTGSTGIAEDTSTATAPAHTGVAATITCILLLSPENQSSAAAGWD